MAEQVLAMALALAKQLPVEHKNISRGEFNQVVSNRTLRSGSCVILGFGGIGRATTRMMHARS